MNLILKHWKTPFHNWEPSRSDYRGRAMSAICGDEINLFLVVVDEVIRDAYFTGQGCTICLGVASLLTQHLIGVSIEKARQLTETEVLSLAGIEIDCRRHDCALVALKALRVALQAIRVATGR